MMETKTMSVTPEMAARWLEGNANNRPIKQILVGELANAMLNGTFRLTHQAIALTSDGRLLDGQHRLLAVVASGRTVNMNVAFNVDPDTYDVIDAGAKRSLADALAVRHGHGYALATSAACRVVALYDRVNPTLTTPWNARTFLNAKLDRATVAEIADEMYPSMMKLVLDIKDYSRSWRIQANSLAALYVIRRDTHQDPDLVDEFIRGLASGANLPAGDVRLKLRDALANNPSFRRNDARLAFGATVKAWNLYVEGDSPKILRFVRDSPGATPL